MEKVYKNSHYLFIAVLLMAVAGFRKTYFGLVPTFTSVSGLMHFHDLYRKIFRPYLIALHAYIGIYAFYLFVINAEDWKRFWWMFF